MIYLPRRSITRFFIPLIDVLILLFAIFIMLPVVDDKKSKNLPGSGFTPEGVQRLKDALAKAQGELERLKGMKATPEETTAKIKELQKILERLPELVEPVILEIDPRTGELSTAIENEDARLKIKNQDDARSFIAQQERKLADKEKKDPIKGVKRKLLFIFQYPPAGLRSAHPTVGEKEEYERWFREVSHRFSN